MPRPMTYDRMKSQKKTPTRKIFIPTDDELAADWQEAQGKLQMAQLRLDLKIENEDIRKGILEDAAKAQARIDELREQMEDTVAVFRFKGIGRKRFAKFQNDPMYQPTEEQIKIAKDRNGPGAQLEFNPETWPPAIIAASLVEPELSTEEVQEMWDDDNWTEAELLLLLGAAMEVNQQVRSVNWGKD